MTSSPYICSLQSLEIQLEESILRHLESQYNNQNETAVGNDEENNKNHTSDDDGTGYDHMERILSAMKRPPAYTTCRVNFIRATRQEVLVELQQLLSPISQLEVQEDQHFPDVINIIPTGSKYDLSDLTGPISGDGNNGDIDATTPKESDVLFSNWPLRKEQGWPMDYRSIICDRFCGEAVLRGSDIFVRGVLAADSGIRAGEKVAVYADIPCKVNNGILTRGLKLEQYRGKCIYLGLGIAECDRNEIFKSTKGKAVTMSMNSKDRCGPMLPPLSGVLQDKMMLQNLPSIFVGHAINPSNNDIILDMCMAPGGKTLHLASLVRNHDQTVIVACDKSRKKVVSAKELFIGMGATCITPLVLDATNCCIDEDVGNSSLKQERKDVHQVRTLLFCLLYRYFFSLFVCLFRHCLFTNV
jgi:predicted ribosome-associated RNA-binding protein Tma20